jgi:hypothetical protein
MWFFDGEFVVERGESWCDDGHFPGFENFPRILDLFFGDSHFGNGGERVGNAPIFL